MYCKDKGDSSIYIDAGQPKCEYSRGICKWDSGVCIETLRVNDDMQVCIDLLEENTLSDELDNGRIKPASPPQETPPQVSASKNQNIHYELLLMILIQ